MKKKLPIILFLLAMCRMMSAQVSFGDAVKFNDSWLFHLGDNPESGQWQEVTLPHDWSVEQHLSPYLASCTGYLPAGIGWYRKTFSGKDITGEKAYIYFEGIYNRSSVYLNGHLLGFRPSGYASFLYDMTPYLDRDGDNIITVKVDHSRYADSRFYTGSGIYRNVHLIQAGNTHFAQWGIGYSAAVVTSSQAQIEVSSEIEGPLAKGSMVQLRLKDAEGETVAKASSPAAAKQSINLKLPRPHLWDIDDPYMYSLEVSLVAGREVLDKAVIPVGIRTLQFDADKGFALNGRWMKVKGVCLHHDAGVLGSAVPDDVWHRRLENLKAIGANAIRTSHNPQAPAFYDLCDKIGLLVMDEAFDEWEFPKKKWLEGWNVGTPGFDGTDDFFSEWGEKDLTDMVRRDRNHPCVFLWSIGNEVDYPNDPYSHPILDGDGLEFTQPLSGGYRPDAPSAMRIGAIAKRLASCVRSVDTSRPVTGALAGVVMSNQTGYPEAVDVVGYNYTESRYGKDHEKYPTRIIYGSENTAGYDKWKAVRDNEHIFGQFIWTGLDYLGESRPWPSRGFGSGMLDFRGFVKAGGRARAAMWCDEPVCYIGTGRGNEETWNYSEGDEVRVTVYTNAAQARLLLNCVQVGETLPYDDAKGCLVWKVPYAAGTLTAEALDPEGNVTASRNIRTSLRPYALRASSDKLALGKDDVAHVVVEVVDEDGVPVNLADNEVRCTVEGPAALLGLESGSNTDVSDYKLGVRRVYQGRLLAYVRGCGTPGEVLLTFTSPLLEPCSVRLQVKNPLDANLRNFPKEGEN